MERRRPNFARENWREAGTIKAVKITVYLFTFATVIGIAAAIAWLSISVAPVGARRDGLTMLAFALGGLGVAGGVVYLAEKLINLAKGVALMLAELIVEKYKKHRFEMGKRAGREETQRTWQAWYRRQQAALREGRPFDELPPGYFRESGESGRDNS